MNELNTRLKNEAVALGLCRKWTEEWRDSESQAELIAKFKKGIDFCIERNWPTVDFIKSGFSHDVLNENGVFVDQYLDMEIPSGTYVVMGACSGTLRVTDWAVATIYVRHDSDLRIEAGTHSRVLVMLYDNARVESRESIGSVIKTIGH